MISVDEALAAIRSAVVAGEREQAPIENAVGRVLADDVLAAIDQPPHDASAMDGYAVRRADIRPGVSLRVVGESAAGAPYDGEFGPGQAVRIFTGGVVPRGADQIVIQENVSRRDDQITVNETSDARHIRPRGIDFRRGDRIAAAGDVVTPIRAALIAASNVAAVSVRRRPVVAYFDNGDELAEPGADLRPGEVVASNRHALAGLIEAWGGAPQYVGRARDEAASVEEAFGRAKKCDIVLTVGGASVGDRDCVRAAFAAAGGELAFSKIAVKPGKPTWFGRLSGRPALGLPGNPASAIVCAVLFLRPLLAAALGAPTPQPVSARLATPLKEGGGREEYIRASLSLRDGALVAAAFPKQDSSLLTPLAAAGCLIRRAADASPATAGDLVDCVPIRDILSAYGR